MTKQIEFWGVVDKNDNRILATMWPESNDSKFIVAAINPTDAPTKHSFQSVIVCSAEHLMKGWIDSEGKLIPKDLYKFSEYPEHQFKFEDLIVIKFVDTRILTTVEL